MNTDRTIERKKLIYETKVEYVKYALNHIKGCAHGCSYCYAYRDCRRYNQVKDRADWKNFKIVINALDILNKELPKWKDKIGEDFIHLCFTTDPFMYNPATNDLFVSVEMLTLHVIKLINDHGLRVETLTKGFYPTGIMNFNLSTKNSYGITLSSLDEQFRFKHEGDSAPYKRRIDSLRMLHNYGLKTWVSIEPYPTPNLAQQNLQELLNSINFVDRIVFGRMNYTPAVTNYPNVKEFYINCAYEVAEFCMETGKEYHIKKGTI